MLEHLPNPSTKGGGHLASVSTSTKHQEIRQGSLSVPFAIFSNRWNDVCFEKTRFSFVFVPGYNTKTTQHHLNNPILPMSCAPSRMGWCRANATSACTQALLIKDCCALFGVALLSCALRCFLLLCVALLCPVLHHIALVLLCHVLVCYTLCCFALLCVALLWPCWQLQTPRPFTSNGNWNNQVAMINYQLPISIFVESPNLRDFQRMYF